MSLWISLTETTTETVFDANITHNLTEMAKEAGIYYALWRPGTINCTRARDIIPMLELGLSKLKEDPEHFEQYDAENGWGTYLQFVPFVEDVLKACKENPEAIIEVSR